MFSCVCFSTYATSVMSSVAVSSKVDRVTDDIIRSPEDARLYRGLELKNGMKILLISDVTTDKSAAALDVHIGIRLVSNCQLLISYICLVVYHQNLKAQISKRCLMPCYTDWTGNSLQKSQNLENI